MKTTVDKFVSLEQSIRMGWLELWYQPKIHLHRRILVGAECLARVRHPEFGIILPGHFLANASKSAIQDLTMHAIVAALHDWSIFFEYGINLTLAVNIPASALLDMPVAAIVRKARPQNEKWPGLILEITEEEMPSDMRAMKDIAMQLKLNDVQLSIDDFGCGYSSIGRICDVPFTELKIDQRFVRDCAANEMNRKACAAIVQVGKQFDLTITAEGVETVSEAHTLRAMGCDLAQGFLYAKPMERDRLIKMSLQRPRIASTDTRTPQNHAPQVARSSLG